MTFLLIGFFFLDTRENLNRKIQILRQNKLVYLYILFFFVQIIGLAYSDNVSFGIKKTILLIPCLFLPGIVLSEKLSKPNYNHLFNIVKWGIVIVFISYLFIHLVLDQRNIRTFVYFTVQKRIGISQFYLSFIFLFGIYECLRKIFSEKSNIVINAFLFLFFMSLLALMGNRTILGITGLFLLFYLLNEFSDKGLIIRLGIILITILSGIGLSQMDIVNRKMNVFVKTTDLDLEVIKTKNRFTITKNTFEHRVLINYLSSKEIFDSFPLGVGTGDYKDVMLERYKEIKFKAGIANEYNLHNQYFSEFLKTGILGGILFMIIIFNLLMEVKRSQKIYSYLAITFCIACTVESYLDRQHGVFIFTLLLPFFIKYENYLNK
nr:O-antigen ligase family protein [Aquimarina sp. MMG016]